MRYKLRVLCLVLMSLPLLAFGLSDKPKTQTQQGLPVRVYTPVVLPSYPEQIVEPAVAVKKAERLETPVQVAVAPPPAPVTPVVATGVWGLPFAPSGLNDCDEFDFYRVQWGLPARFSQLAWRESNCRNEDSVKTYCCYGYLQLYISLQISDHRMTNRYHECGVYSYSDVNSDTSLDKQRHLCAAAVLYSVVGYSAWGM